MGGPTEWWTGDTSDRPDDAPPSTDPASFWSHIVEETPDPHGPFWVTEEHVLGTDKTVGLLTRVESAGSKADPVLLDALRTLLAP
jgi:hypothetical protein